MLPLPQEAVEIWRRKILQRGIEERLVWPEQQTSRRREGVVVHSIHTSPG
jgi:hypothetical protein